MGRKTISTRARGGVVINYLTEESKVEYHIRTAHNQQLPERVREKSVIALAQRAFFAKQGVKVRLK